MPLTTVAQPATRGNLGGSSSDVAPPFSRRLPPMPPSVLPAGRQVVQQVFPVVIVLAVLILSVALVIVLVAGVHVGRALGQGEAAEQAVGLVVGAGGEVELVGVEGGVRIAKRQGPQAVDRDRLAG